MKRNKAIMSVIMSLLLIITIFCGCNNSNIENTTKPTETTTVEQTTEPEVTISADVKKEAEKTKDEVENGEDIGTDKPIIAKPKDESTVVDESLIEQDAVVEQENISYDGTNTGKGKALLGACTGLTYYNQADSRWAKAPYTSSKNKTQTIKSSGCGPTSAAMVVSSSKGAILPATMAKLFVDNGYRTKSNGTAWSAWSFVADYFNFKKYATTSNIDKALNYLKKDKNKDGVSDYFIVASCNYGLFTTSGHYIVLVGYNSGSISVYDPYSYVGKFNTPSRKAAGAKLSGNTVFVSEKNFKKYGNTVNYWVFSNDYKKKKSKAKKNVTKYVATQSQSLNVRAKANKSSKVLTQLKKGTKVTVTKVSGSWSYITAPTKGWVSTAYLSSTKVVADKPKKVTYKTTVGKHYRLKGKTYLYKNKKLTGIKFEYLPKTEIIVQKHISATVDKVKVVKTGRVAYAKVNSYK